METADATEQSDGPIEGTVWEDYARFHGLMIGTGDVDPVYLVYRRMAEDQGWTRAERITMVLLHVAYYHAGSALAAFNDCGGDLARVGECRTDLPCGTERRGHRNPAALSKHLNELARSRAEIEEWAGEIGGLRNRHSGWARAVRRFSTLHGNGRWAAYKTAEMLKEVAGLRIDAPDMDHAYSSGPRKGLARLFKGVPEGNSYAVVGYLDMLSGEVIGHLRTAGHFATMATAETTLCDFNSLLSGRYYVGHDIDQMQAQLNAVPSPLTIPAHDARAAMLPTEYLGEFGDWVGVDRPRMKVYRDTGEIIERVVQS